MASIVIAGDTSGAVTIAAPATAGTPTLTLPTTSGTLVVTGGAQTIEFAAGSVSAPSITFTGDTNTGIYSPAADTIAFTEGGVESMRIDSSGNVGIGTSSPSAKLQVTGNSGNAIAVFDKGGANQAFTQLKNSSISYNTYVDINNNGGNIWALYDATNNHSMAFYTPGASGSWQFFTANAERMRIDSSGNVGIGISSPASNRRLDATINQNNSAGIRTTNTSTGALASSNITCANATNNAEFGILGSGYGGYGVLSANGAYIYTNTGAIQLAADNNFIAFGTGTGVPERMRITSGGLVLVNRTSDIGNGILQISGIVDNRVAIQTYQNATTVQGAIWFNNPNGTVGTINTSGTSTTYATSSDYRLKENIAPMTGALDKVAQLKPCTYNWKVDGSNGQGFIAHELAEVVPDCVTGEKDAVDKDGNPEYQGVDTSFLVATLTAAIQELNAKVEAQAAEIAALKGAN